MIATAERKLVPFMVPELDDPGLFFRSLWWYMKFVVHRLKKLDKEQIFHFPVDLALAPDYLDVVKNPLDLSTLGNHVEDKKYPDLDSFFNDVFLMFDNCMLYNDNNTIFAKRAKYLKRHALKLLSEIKSDLHLQQHQPFIHPYEPLTSMKIAIDEALVKKKLSTSLRGHCSCSHEDLILGKGCGSFEGLGKFDLNSHRFDSSCSARSLGVECQDCCNTSLCHNQALVKQEFDAVFEKRMVYGIDQHTFRSIVVCLRACVNELVSDAEIGKSFIESKLLPAINKYVPEELTTVRQNAHMKHALQFLMKESEASGHQVHVDFCKRLVLVIQQGARFPIYSKGYGAILVSDGVVRKNQFLGEYLGEIYPPWRWIEKQKIMKLYHNEQSFARVLGFYNILLERHR
jgi:hypothetical protein